MNLFSKVYSQNNLSITVKNRANVVNLDTQKQIRSHQIFLYVKDNSVTHFDSSCIEHIPNEAKTFVDKKYHNKYLQNTGL